MLFNLNFMYLVLKSVALAIVAVSILSAYPMDRVAVPILLALFITIDTVILLSQRKMIDERDVTIDKS